MVTRVLLDERLVISDAQREAVMRLVANESDADLLLSMLLGVESGTDQPRARRAATRPVSEAERARIRWMRSKGMTINAIAEEIGRSRVTVSRALKEMEK